MYHFEKNFFEDKIGDRCCLMAYYDNYYNCISKKEKIEREAERCEYNYEEKIDTKDVKSIFYKMICFRCHKPIESDLPHLIVGKTECKIDEEDED